MTPQDPRVLPDAEAVALALVGEIRAQAARAIAARGAFHLALSGGATPRLLYERLAAELPEAAGWHLWFGDERCVPPDHPASNQRMVREAWIEGARGTPPELHPMDASADPDLAAVTYAAELRAATEDGRLDQVLLGLGTDGHTASLFPGDAALEERERSVVAVEPPGVGPPRITLTLPTLAAAGRVDFLVTGAAKAPMVARILAGQAADRPAARVRSPELTWWLDRAAAQELPRSGSD